VIHTNVLCRIGMHRWSFMTKPVQSPGGGVRVEAVYARCRRADCPTFSQLRLVHWEGEATAAPAAVSRSIFLPSDVF
jgi:hypothetical protein